MIFQPLYFNSLIVKIQNLILAHAITNYRRQIHEQNIHNDATYENMTKYKAIFLNIYVLIKQISTITTLYNIFNKCTLCPDEAQQIPLPAFPIAKILIPNLPNY